MSQESSSALKAAIFDDPGFYRRVFNTRDT